MKKSGPNGYAAISEYDENEEELSHASVGVALVDDLPALVPNAYSNGEGEAETSAVTNECISK